MQLHVHTQEAQQAPYVLLPGDPGRATFIAETFFDNPELTTTNRGLLGYRGTYKGVPVSVQTTGMGCPSLAIVTEELVNLGTKALVRVGTAGVISQDVQPGDVIVASGSVPADGTTRQYLKGAPTSAVPDFTVTRALMDAANTTGGAHVGLLRTEDAFYATKPEDVPALAADGVLAVEMEAAALFVIGRLRRVQTGCMVVASNGIGDDRFAPKEVMQAAITRMVSASLEAFVALDADAT
jgi:purine-nucleoside phosphorylase